MLVLGGTLRCLLGVACQLQCQLKLGAPLQHPDQPQAGPGIPALAIDRQRCRPIGHPLTVLPKLKQQFAAPLLKPGVGRLQCVDLFDHLRDILASFKALLALVQIEIGLQVVAAAQTTGLGTELDVLVSEDAEIGQHELRPVLVQVAKEHQAQAVGQVHDAQAQ
ncbi:hypothetical protein D3C85_665710 [compost metagenome]